MTAFLPHVAQLHYSEARPLPQLPCGQAGKRSFLVEHRLSSAELGLVDTDQRMIA